jgi:hypothetical protein
VDVPITIEIESREEAYLSRHTMEWERIGVSVIEETTS